MGAFYTIPYREKICVNIGGTHIFFSLYTYGVFCSHISHIPTFSKRLIFSVSFPAPSEDIHKKCELFQSVKCGRFVGAFPLKWEHIVVVWVVVAREVQPNALWCSSADALGLGVPLARAGFNQAVRSEIT